MADDIARPEIDRIMAVAWPPTVVEKHGRWSFRYTSGVTRRANSVLVIGQPPDLDKVVEKAEAFYRHRDASTVFLVSDASAPAAVQDGLVERGYSPRSTNLMLTGSTLTVTTSLPSDDRWRVEVSDEPTAGWFKLYWSIESGRHPPGTGDVMRTQLLRPDEPARFVTAHDGDSERGDAVAVGQVVIDNGWGCLQCLATAPAGRRRGAATQIFRALAQQTVAAGASNVFAAVVADNTASLNLCRRAGMRQAHRYRYFE